MPDIRRARSIMCTTPSSGSVPNYRFQSLSSGEEQEEPPRPNPIPSHPIPSKEQPSPVCASFFSSSPSTVRTNQAMGESVTEYGARSRDRGIKSLTSRPFLAAGDVASGRLFRAVVVVVVLQDDRLCSAVQCSAVCHLSQIGRHHPSPSNLSRC